MKILICFGTRPEFIKLAPLYLALKKTRHEVTLLSTGQHKELLLGIGEFFGIREIIDLNSMRAEASTFETQINIQVNINRFLLKNPADFIFVHGDTASTLSAALASFSNRIPFAHVEAGLRSYDLNSPWPEEGIRRIVDNISTFKFAPTKIALNNLANEGLSQNSFMTGNTIVDAVRIIRENLKAESFAKRYLGETSMIINEKPYILVTQHRRESFNGGLDNVLSAITQIAQLGISVIWPTHPNPNVQRLLQNSHLKNENLHFIEAQDYPAMINLIANARLVISDSGGIQEEAPILGVPLLITREKTERPESLDNANSKLVGFDKQLIIKSALEFYESNYSLEKQELGKKLYGDGFSSELILSHLDLN